MQIGAHAVVTHTVTDADTAIALGSGDVPVLGTPRLVALAETATVAAVAGAMEPGHTTVGTRVELDHVAASPVGRAVEIRAELVEVDGRILFFTVSATDSTGETIALGSVVRAVVDRTRFLARL